MNLRLRSIIHELAQSSSAASSISSRLLESLSNDNDLAESVSQLKQEVAKLTQQLKALQEEQVVEDAIYSEEELSMFRSSFEFSLSQLTVPFISKFYAGDYFLDKPKNVRLVIATSLVNNFAKRNIEPLDVWLKIIATNGAV